MDQGRQHVAIPWDGRCTAHFRHCQRRQVRGSIFPKCDFGIFFIPGLRTKSQEPDRSASDTVGRGSVNRTPSTSLNSGPSGQNSSAANEGIIEDRPARLPRWKRVLDLTLVFVSFPIWLSLMVLMMILIKIGSSGPILYRQERVGYRRKLFMIFKFRSMKVNAETGSHERHLASLMGNNSPMTKLDAAGDPRLIPLGRIFRATGLDELPQIFNVIRGEMSLVGPRPCLPYEFQRYERWQQERVNAAPGLTGYWQVNGKNKTTFSEMIDMDILYTKKMSLWLDLTIIFKTVPAVIQQVLEAQTRARTQRVASEAVRREPSGLRT